MTGPEAMMFGANGWVPNNTRLPVLVYRGVVPAGAPEPIERTLVGNGWPPDWRDGVFDFHHYHSTAHEALACVAGSARLMLGGEGGREMTVEAGDLLVLPAGTGHRRTGASADFLLVGAYPDGQAWDVCREPADAETLARIAAVPVPGTDPLEGGAGPLTRLWEDPIIDLDTATAEELDAVPALKGHGFEIVRYREERGRFDALRQLEEVPGMAGKADGLADHLGIG